MEMSLEVDDLIVVIRSAGERTTDVCRDLVLQQVPPHRVHMVCDFPFEKTLRRCYEIGIASDAKWMMTLDADVLLRQGAVQDFLNEAEALPLNYFQIEGLLHDKLSSLHRKAGHRMYRTRYLRQAVQCLPQPRTELRPERATLRKMERLGYLSEEIKMVFGIHDYEQFYKDIYRKTFVHAKKHPGKLRTLIELWTENANQDIDFQVALRGLYDGLMYTHSVAIDKRDFVDRAETALQELDVIEKETAPELNFCIDLVRSTLNEHKPLDSEKQLLNTKEYSQMKLESEKKTKKISLLKHKYYQLGAIRLALYLTGTSLSSLGSYLKKISLKSKY